jgi:hypothetical protein
MEGKSASQDPPAISAKTTTTLRNSEQDDSNGPQFGLLDLPSELLLQTALQVSGTEAILSLSLVNKYLHGIAQEAIGKKLVNPTNRILEALRMLMRHPELTPKVKILDLENIKPRTTVDVCVCVMRSLTNMLLAFYALRSLLTSKVP